ncbi:OsmC family protein [Actinopolymorpha singaporensis]|uniref:Uncharacterized OsmC-related protein n=1 Tax=Actinopolymorpha singaporensis TaxID=117157 RepID=A0A1H1Y9C0_9ACTN|nr:OsmC family protein [Actinopolymorpha singaporensis]SDT18128.1 Uncharacterized OsmC-related protein [Actinopolymorpha singaporensis]
MSRHEPAPVEVRPLEGDAYVVEVRGHQLHVDQPREEGGTDTAPTPVELLVGALAACVAFHAGRFLARHGVGAEGLAVRAMFTMAAEGSTRVDAVHVRVVVPPDLPPERVPALRAVLGACTVKNTLTHAVELDLEIDGFPSLAPG